MIAEFERVCATILNPFTYLYDDCVDKFINLVVESCPQYAEMKSVLYCQNPEEYTRIGIEQCVDDIQIIFEDGTKISFVEPRTLQPDLMSCGVFAIANATSIIFGVNPADYPLLLRDQGDRTMPLRQHLVQMLRTKQLALFPMVNEN